MWNDATRFQWWLVTGDWVCVDWWCKTLLFPTLYLFSYELWEHRIIYGHPLNWLNDAIRWWNEWPIEWFTVCWIRLLITLQRFTSSEHSLSKCIKNAHFVFSRFAFASVFAGCIFVDLCESIAMSLRGQAINLNRSDTRNVEGRWFDACGMKRIAYKLKCFEYEWIWMHRNSFVLYAVERRHPNDFSSTATTTAR